MRCRVCYRQARGFGHLDIRFKVADPRRYPWDGVFCSRRCQTAFQRLYHYRVAASGFGGEVVMIDATEVERAALRACLKPFGEAAGVIGFDKPLGAYSEAEALAVIEAIVTGFTGAMVAHHAASRYPPLRGLPPRDAATADFDDDIPF